MTSSEDNKASFFQALADSFRELTFLKATLSHPVQEPRWKRITLSTFTDSQGIVHVSFEYFDGRQVEHRNLRDEGALEELRSWIPGRMRNAFVKLRHEELMFEATAQGTFRLKRKAIATPEQGDSPHNRKKNYAIPEDSPFLVELGIASRTGGIKRDRYDKFRQIQRFVEVISDLVSEPTPTPLSVVDFGSGKHYLTFALHSFLAHQKRLARVVGVEQRQELVEFGSATASKLGASGLHFEQGAIASYPLESADLMVALHACNTATDDVLSQAIRAKVRFICVAPCCHSYVRQHFSTSEDLRAMLRHGIIAERFAEGLTDSLRVLVLEALGYQTKLFEFISLEHTAKNVMITARYTGKRNNVSLQMLQNLKDKFSLPDFYLDKALHELLTQLDSA